MAPHSSQSSAPSPSLKRKQATISSFFTQKPSPTPKTTSSAEAIPERISKKRAASPTEPSPEHKRALSGQETEEDEDDIVAPPSKRARINGFVAAKTKQAPVPAEVPLHPDSQLSSSQRTDIFKFQSSPAVAPPRNEPNDPEEAEQRKEKARLHEKFVRKLGGPDCLIGIGRAAASETAGEVEDDEEEDEPAPPPPTKGRGAAKKGGSKLTPMEKQVIEIKRKHMGTVLVIEVGYKFRFFGEDARIAAKELGIVCIPGKMRFDERMSMSPSEESSGPK
jgi:DNA mismatch repair protein MSH3